MKDIKLPSENSNLLQKLKKVPVIGSLRQITGKKEIRKWMGMECRNRAHFYTVTTFYSLLYGYNSTCTLIRCFLVMTGHY